MVLKSGLGTAWHQSAMCIWSWFIFVGKMREETYIFPTKKYISFNVFYLHKKSYVFFGPLVMNVKKKTFTTKTARMSNF